eukprot:3225097-Rhodomonas_salina.1
MERDEEDLRSMRAGEADDEGSVRSDMEEEDWEAVARVNWDQHEIEGARDQAEESRLRAEALEMGVEVEQLREALRRDNERWRQDEADFD